MELKLVVPVKPAQPDKRSEVKTKEVFESENMIAFRSKKKLIKT
jgi:hypothetical protein